MVSTRMKALGVGALVGGLALVGVGVALEQDRGEPRAAPEAGALLAARSPTRSLKARLTWPGADVYRPHAAPDAGAQGAPPRPLPLQWLAGLEKAGDVRGLAALSLLEGNLGTAANYLEHAPATLEVDSDRAVLALEKGEPAVALALLERVLQRDSHHPQALWNRALVLDELQLWASSAEAFEAVAALSEPGWGEEARHRAAELRARSLREQQDWSDSGRALVEGSRLPSEAQVRERPGYFRRSFYDALRAARPPRQLQALEPVAAALDAHFGGTVLRQALAWTRQRDLHRRAPLAELYLHLLQEPSPPHDHRRDLERLRAAGEPDLFMGALVLTRSVGAHLPEYESLARASGDPWLQLQAEEYRAEAAINRGALLEAEQVLVPALTRCREEGLAFRCVYLLRQMSRLYRQRHWPEEAMRYALEALELTRRERMWGVQPSLLMELGQLARFRQQNALARAWLNEALARAPEDCPTQRFVHENNADMLADELAVPQARQELEAALRCGLPLSPTGAMALVQLSRLAPQPGDAALLARSLEDIRIKKGLGPAELTLTYTLEGRFALERDRAAGEALVRRAIAEAERLPRWDASARKARSNGYTALMRVAAGAGELARVLTLLEEESQERLPTRCLLALAAEAEWTLAVVRGSQGELLGQHDTRRTLPLGERVAGLVPEALLAPLRACERVEVVARPPLHGRAELLPPEVAWSYFTPRHEPRPAAPRAGLHLVVADVQAPPHLGLAALRAWAHPPRDALVLSGPEATPSRVLEEMERATEIEVHAHGLVSPSLSDASLLVLSPEQDGRYALSVSELRSRHLRGRPLVTLASCRAAHTGPVLHEPFSLPVAFLEAGARTVLAATVDVPDAEARPFFDDVLARIRAGVHPAIAVREVRVAWLARDPGSWVRAVLVFD